LYYFWRFHSVWTGTWLCWNLIQMWTSKSIVASSLLNCFCLLGGKSATGTFLRNGLLWCWRQIHLLAIAVKWMGHIDFVANWVNCRNWMHESSSKRREISCCSKVMKFSKLMYNISKYFNEYFKIVFCNGNAAKFKNWSTESWC